MPSPRSPERTNGHAPVRLSRVLQRVERIGLDELNYPGQWVEVITSLARRDHEAWLQRDAIVIADLLPRIVVAWSLAEADGAPLPITAESCSELVPADILTWVFNRWVEALTSPLLRAEAARPSSVATPAPASPAGSPSTPTRDGSGTTDPGS